MAFSEDEGGEAHCQSGAQRLAFTRVYDWLDQVMPRHLVPYGNKRVSV